MSKIYSIFLYFILFNSFSVIACEQQRPINCLPAGRKLTDIVSATLVLGENDTVTTVTIEQELQKLQAKCKNNRLVDSSGKEIHFYQVIGCWGNPPQNYPELLQVQKETISRLEKQFTVIQMTCNPTGIPYP